MRQLFLVAACLGVTGCDVFYVPRFDAREIQEWRLCKDAAGTDVEAHIRTDPRHCGTCGNDCGDGVTCVEGQCNFSTRIHCGGAGRTCIGFEGGVDVDCVFVGDTDFDPALGPVVRGFACAPVASIPPLEAPPTPPVGEDVPGPVELVVGDPPLAPDWILVPGRSTNCRDRVDARCYQTEVEVRDVCGETCTARIGHDFELMTTEMSRAMYRAALECTCTGMESPQCIDLCNDDEDEAALPITGLSWCEAYEACRAVGGRLPTVVERARVEAMVDVDRGLFTRSDVCNDWIDAVGSAPRVAECFDQPEALGLDRVDGLEGAVPIGTDVLPEARYFHHLFGNVDEWLADPVEGSTCEALTQSVPWGPSESPADLNRARLAHGRSIFSPNGETGDRNIALAPGAQAAELGVRCARTSVDTAPSPAPYDASVDAREHAFCGTSATGYRAVRHAVGDRVYRGVGACVDWPVTPTDGAGRFLEEVLAQAFAGEVTALARHPLGRDGPPLEIGQARFEPDEQWWVAEPAGDPGDPLRFEVEAVSLHAAWDGEYTAFGPACADRMQGDTPRERTDGRRAIGQTFIVEVESLAPLIGRGDSGRTKQFACQHLDCAEPVDAQGACEALCTAWYLPVVVDFQRVEPVDRAALCAPEMD